MDSEPWVHSGAGLLENLPVAPCCAGDGLNFKDGTCHRGLWEERQSPALGYEHSSLDAAE